MSPLARINSLLVAHNLLAYGSVAILLFSDRVNDWVAVFVGLLFVSDVSLSGTIAGLARSYRGSPRSRMPEALTRTWMGLFFLWLPIAFIASLWVGNPKPFFGSAFMIGLILGMVSLTTTSTLRTFGLRLSDDSAAAATSPIQFSMRHLFALTTLVAAICGAVRLLMDIDQGKGNPLGGLAVVLMILFCLLVALGGVWLLTIGVPLFTVFVVRRPWRASVGAVVIVQAATLGVLFLLGPRRPGDSSKYLTYSALIGGHQLLVMASLGVLRSCGVKLVRRNSRRRGHCTARFRSLAV